MIATRLTNVLGAVYSEKVVVAVSDTAISIHKIPKPVGRRSGPAKLLSKHRTKK